MVNSLALEIRHALLCLRVNSKQQRRCPAEISNWRRHHQLETRRANPGQWASDGRNNRHLIQNKSKKYSISGVRETMIFVSRWIRLTKKKKNSYTERNLKWKRIAFISVRHFYFMEIQHNFKSLCRTIVVHVIFFTPFLYFKTWSLVQQYQKQNLMSQMEPLMTIKYTFVMLRFEDDNLYLHFFINSTIQWTIRCNFVNKYNKMTTGTNTKKLSYFSFKMRQINTWWEYCHKTVSDLSFIRKQKEGTKYLHILVTLLTLKQSPTLVNTEYI